MRIWLLMTRWLLALLLVASSCAAPAPVVCRGSGGKDGADAQLRFVDARDGQVVFTFGPSPVSDSFGVPAYTLERTRVEGDLYAVTLTFRGASMRYPDGTTSYDGPVTISVAGAHVADVELASDRARTMQWTIRQHGECARVFAKTYVYGKSPRAQLALTFGGTAAFTLETTSDFIGTPQDTPVQASGMGFAPNTIVTITLGDAKVWDTTTDHDGNLDTGFNIGYPAPGPYTVTASDGQGHSGMTTIRVILPTNPLRP